MIDEMNATTRQLDVPLMHTLSQFSYWPAKHIGDMGLKAMHERGRMQEGMVADITIFDKVDLFQFQGRVG